jgi:hypothetical protein
VRRRGGHSVELIGRLALVAVALACGGDGGVGPSRCDGPVFLGASATPSAANVLSALVTARVRGADSIAVAIRHGASDAEMTPAVVPRADSAPVPVLGLLPGSAYDLQVVAFHRCGVAVGPAVAFTTGALPSDLPSYTAGGPSPTDGFVVFAAGPYGLVIDNAGRVVWYVRFSSGPGLNFQAQPNGRYVARPPSPSPDAPWLEVDPLGTITRTLGCARGLSTRFHDMMMLADGSYWVMCDDSRTMNLSAEGGLPDARVTGTAIQRVSASGALLFEWNPFDHLAITDLAATERRGANVNWTHGNAIDLDHDGNLLVSFRSLNEILKIDTRSGAILWRLGGLANQFTFSGSDAPPFWGQHGVRVTADGSILLLDNLGEVSGSRAERYEIDEARRTARLVRAFSPDVAVTAQLGGTTQPLASGHALVSYGSGARVEEYDAAGASVWRIQGNPGYVFRAQRIRSLYRPGVGSPR